MAIFRQPTRTIGWWPQVFGQADVTPNLLLEELVVVVSAPFSNFNAIQSWMQQAVGLDRNAGSGRLLYSYIVRLFTFPDIKWPGPPTLPDSQPTPREGFLDSAIMRSGVAPDVQWPRPFTPAQVAGTPRGFLDSVIVRSIVLPEIRAALAAALPDTPPNLVIQLRRDIIVQGLSLAGATWPRWAPQPALVPVFVPFVPGGLLDPTRRFVGLLQALRYNLTERWLYDLALLDTSYTLIAKWGPGLPFFGSFPPVAPSQKQTVSFDFGQFLPPGVVLTGTPTATVSVAYGTDTSPSSRIVSGPTIGTVSVALGGSGIPNTAILLQLATCVAGTKYIIEVVCARTDGDIAEGSATLQCNTPGV